MDSKEIKLVNSKGNQPWIFIGRNDADAEAPVLWPPDVKSQLTGKDPDTRKNWGQEEKRVTEDEMVGWHHQLSEHEINKLWEMVMDREAWHDAAHGVTKSQTRMSYWTELVSVLFIINKSYHFFVITYFCFIFDCIDLSSQKYQMLIINSKIPAHSTVMNLIKWYCLEILLACLIHL